MQSYVAREGEALLRHHRHELIVSHDFGIFSNGRGCARISRTSGVPYLSEIHHVPGYPVAADLRERLDFALARRYVRWARSRALAFRIVNAGEMPALLRSWGVPEPKILVIPSLYIDLTTFAPPREPLEPAQDVAFVGRMVVNKGAERIVDALASLAKRGRRLRALFVGNGPRLERVRRRVHARGLESSVRFVDWVGNPEELAQVYRSSRTLVCASTCEGGPRVTVEAMACGTPVVSTPVGMMKELLREGENGALAGFDVESLASAIERVLADEGRRRAMGERARACVQRFEYAAAIRNYAASLHRLAGRELA